MKKAERLEYWQQWTNRNKSACSDELEKMDAREKLYRGEVEYITPLTELDTDHGHHHGKPNRIVHLRNIINENIESCVSSAIPQPKVTARHREDEWRAKILEDMLRNELDRLPMEELNDKMERTIPIQGGAYWLVEWDNRVRTHSTVGDVRVDVLHPKQVIPQDGVFTRVEDMDAVVLLVPQTKAYIKAMYGEDLENTGEENPEVRGLDDDTSDAEDVVTQYIAYYRNDRGGIGKFSWVGDTVLEDREDYEARLLRRCTVCNSVVPYGDKECPECGATQAREQVEAEEDVFLPIQTAGGTQIPGATTGVDENGLPMEIPTKLPNYQPDVFPVFLQRNITLYGKLLGDSDVDKIRDQQNTMNRLEKKIIDRLVKAGTRITLPDRADFRVDPIDGERWYIGSPQDKAMIDVLQFDGNLQWEMQYYAAIYEEARQILGITDSFQGRTDTTAKSGVAKQFAAAQSAGRLESRRVLKEAAYAELFKRICQLKVAYCDEPRPIVSQDNRGNAKYSEFNRYDFYEQDESGKWHCVLDDDRFLFSADSATPLANNREAMWQDTTSQFQMGAFGNPQDINTLIVYWTKLRLLHYPGADDTLQYFEEMQKQQEMAQLQQMQMQQEQAQQQYQQQMEMQAIKDAQAEALRRAERQNARQDADRQTMIDIDKQARQDAMAEAQRRAQARQQIPGAMP